MTVLVTWNFSMWNWYFKILHITSFLFNLKSQYVKTHIFMFFLGKLCKSWYIPHLESAQPCLTPHQPHHHLSSCPLGSTTCLVAPVKTRTATAVINPHSGGGKAYHSSSQPLPPTNRTNSSSGFPSSSSKRPGNTTKKYGKVIHSGSRFQPLKMGCRNKWTYKPLALSPRPPTLPPTKMDCFEAQLFHVISGETCKSEQPGV